MFEQDGTLRQAGKFNACAMLSSLFHSDVSNIKCDKGSPMGVMGVPPSVLRSSPLSVWTSKMGLFTAKKPGFPQPVTTCMSDAS